MEDELINSLKDLAKLIEQLDELMKFAPCIICGEEVHTWAGVIPADEESSLGFGTPKDKDMKRIALVHACRAHDFADETNIQIVRESLRKAAEWNARKN